MTKISKINNEYKKPFLNPKNTGYLAAGSMLITTARYVSSSKSIKKSHKFWDY
ncbi:hypothetical protein J6R97_03145 [bacterium]|nr:hypothetical protein [bacterium]